MDLQKAFKACQSSTAPVTAFVVDQSYPLLFFSHLLRNQHNDADQMVCLDVAQRKEQEIKAQLETSFLGMKRTYWLGALHQLNKKKAQDLLVYLHGYHGPNRILVAVSDELIKPYQKKTGVIEMVAVPTYITRGVFVQLFTYFVREPNQMDKRYIEQLYMRTDKINLDIACVLMHYLQVMGSKAQDFFAHWLDQLVVPETSLFKLSQYFFAQQKTTFLKKWHDIKDEYPDQFWISFWSEQLWRGLFYCQAMQKRDIAHAKKIGYRLPFSFLQKDYRLYKIDQLQQAHQWLYDLDVSLKNGGDPIGLDIFLSRFFAQAEQ